MSHHTFLFLQPSILERNMLFLYIHINSLLALTSLVIISGSEQFTIITLYFCFHNKLGWILIDRCGKHFGIILNFLRDGSVPLPQSEAELREVYAEAKYYLIEQLVSQCETALAKKHAQHDPICRVPLITSSKEERLLVTTSPKVGYCINLLNACMCSSVL